MTVTQERRGTPIRHEYHPRGGCKEVFDSKEEEVLVSGPAGTGKSRACLEKVFAMCLLTANTRALLLRKTARSLGSTALVTWRNFVVKEALETGEVVYYGGSSQEAAQYRFKNGSTVTIGGLDNPTRIMSSEYDVVYVQEATEITITDLEFIKTRLRNWRTSFQQLIMDCNPAGDKHWLKLRCNDGKTKLIHSRHEDNPRLFAECAPETEGAIAYYGSSTGFVRVTKRGAAYIAILDSLTGVRYKRLRLGLWVSAEGIIYEEFDPAVHVLPWEVDDDGNRVPLPSDWPRYWVIDFGYVHPFVCKWYAEGPDGELYMYREIHMSRRLVEEHASQIMSLVTEERTIEWYDHLNKTMRTKTETVWTEPYPDAVICDHDAEGRKTFEKHTGIGTKPAIKWVDEGIDLHKARLKVDERTGLARFYLMADALVEVDEHAREHLMPISTEEEYASYVWKVAPDGRTKPEPVKLDDDGVDCDRYMTMEKDFKGKARATLLPA